MPARPALLCDATQGEDSGADTYYGGDLHNDVLHASGLSKPALLPDSVSGAKSRALRRFSESVAGSDSIVLAARAPTAPGPGLGLGASLGLSLEGSVLGSKVQAQKMRRIPNADDQSGSGGAGGGGAGGGMQGSPEPSLSLSLSLSQSQSPSGLHDTLFADEGERTQDAEGSLLDLDSPRSALSVVGSRGGDTPPHGDSVGGSVGAGPRAGGRFGRGGGGGGGGSPPRPPSALAAASTAASEAEWCGRCVMVGGWDRRPWFRRVVGLGAEGGVGYPAWSGAPKEFLKALVAAPVGDAGTFGRPRVWWWWWM